MTVIFLKFIAVVQVIYCRSVELQALLAAMRYWSLTVTWSLTTTLRT